MLLRNGLECGLFELTFVQNSECIKNNDGNFNDEGIAEDAKEVLKLQGKIKKALRLP